MEITQRRKNPLGLWIGVALVLFGILAVLNGVRSLTDNKTRLIAPRGVITVELADDQQERSVGLSGRSELARDAGMLFIFEEESVENCFWMKDTLINLDMIWMDSDKQVITVTENVSTDTFPENFCPESEAKYGLEINAGVADDLKITKGESLRF